MAWHTKYWDAVNQLYWTPSHLGLQSIPKSQWGEDVKLIQMSRDRIKNGGTIYTRAGTFRSNSVRMRALEETLNHIFDITFSVGAHQTIGKLFHKAASIEDNGPFERLGQEVGSRFGWGEANVTQHDGFFVSPKSILSVELKLNSATWPQQVLKYVAMTLLEERLTGRRGQLGLLYITPSAPSKVWQQAGCDENGHLPNDFITQFETEKLNPRLKQLYVEDIVGLQDVAERMRLAHLSWADLIYGCDAIVANLDLTRPGDETMARLLIGFMAAVREHEGTDVLAKDNVINPGSHSIASDPV